jgi:hypothetical protein
VTVCIAAFAAKSKAIICIADRALTYAGWAANSETDSGVSKIIDLPGNWCALFSGDNLTFPKRVLDRVTRELAKIPDVTLRDVETAAKESFEHWWWQEIEDQILKPILLKREDFNARSKDVQPLDSQLVLKLAEQMTEHKQPCSIIFCGFDRETAHIFTVSTPCQLDDFGWQGFSVVGGGIETARNHLLWARYDKDDPLASALYDVFDAKVATEVLQTMGYAWNWRLIVPGRKPEPLPKNIDKLIDRLWTESNLSPFSEKSKIKPATIEDWKKKIRAFAASALSSARKAKAE